MGRYQNLRQWRVGDIVRLLEVLGVVVGFDVVVVEVVGCIVATMELAFVERVEGIVEVPGLVTPEDKKLEELLR